MKNSGMRGLELSRGEGGVINEVEFEVEDEDVFMAISRARVDILEMIQL